MRLPRLGLVHAASALALVVAGSAPGCATTDELTGGSSLSAGNLSAGTEATEGTDGTSAGTSMSTSSSGSSTTKGTSSSSSSSTTTSTSDATGPESTTGVTATTGDTSDGSSSGTTGLECDDGLGNLCGNPMDVGAVDVGGSAMTPMGTIITAGVSDWYRVQFPATGRPGGGTPTINFMMNEDDAFVFDLTTTMPCMGAAVTCQMGGDAGKANKLTEFSFVDNDPMCCSPPMDSQTPWPANLFVRVYRVDGGQTCSAYQLVFTR